jgi:hypothetical protein
MFNNQELPVYLKKKVIPTLSDTAGTAAVISSIKKYGNGIEMLHINERTA